MANTEISLQCGHIVYFSTKALPDTGERIWCVRCQRYRRVTSDTHTYTLRCYGRHGRHGNYRRTFGHLRFTAEQACIQHRLKYPTHTVVLLQDGKVIATYAAQERALPPGMGLPGMGLSPPF